MQNVASLQPIDTGVFEIFKIGIGPSSSHTMGPMIAARHFRMELSALRPVRIAAVLHGSLGATGKGHATDQAIIAGLCGLHPADCAGDEMSRAVHRVIDSGEVRLAGTAVGFSPARDLVFAPHTQDLPHPNTLDLTAFDSSSLILLHRRYCSVGGGFVEIADADGSRRPLAADAAGARKAPLHAFTNTLELMRCCKKFKIGWADVALANEMAVHGRTVCETEAGLREIWKVMRRCIARGIASDPESKLPGPLNVYRRAPRAYAAARSGNSRLPLTDPVELLTHAYALAVNEENASGHQVVTAPTNGAAGVIPAAFAALQDVRGFGDDRIVRGLLTAGLVGAIVKREASLSGAEMGCQGEVGSASAMAAGGIVEMMGGSPDQVEMAAEIAIEHHLGMTCDPIAGLVQIPCIERNVMGAVKALHAATLALGSSGKHRISFDEALAAMRQIGLDMNAKYKETSQGGLAAAASAPHHVAC